MFRYRLASGIKRGIPILGVGIKKVFNIKKKLKTFDIMWSG